MASRYCSNCGQELTEDSRFCPNCGRPVHETAHVSTPEADVPVPPPPGQQEAGGTTPYYAPTGAAPRQRSIAGRLFIGCAGLFVLGILFVGCLAILGSGGGGGGESAGSNDPPTERKKNAADETKELPTKKKHTKDKQPAVDKQAAQDPEPKPESPAEPEPIKLSGTGSQATKFFELEEGLMVVDMAHQGSMNFIVTLLDEQGKEVAFALGNAIGTVQISNAAHIPEAGRYILDVEADGRWQMTVRQPRPAEVPARTSFSGQGGAATELFSMNSGLKRINFSHQGEMNFIVTLLDSEGREVEFALANDIGTVETSTTATIPQDGIYLFQVEADGPWTIDVE